MRPEGFSMKNSNETIGNRTCDIPVCRAVPQPTAPPRDISPFFFKFPTKRNYFNMIHNKVNYSMGELNLVREAMLNTVLNERIKMLNSSKHLRTSSNIKIYKL